MDFKNALQLDAMDTSHPIEVPVGHPDEVDEIFDHIRYNIQSSPSTAPLLTASPPPPNTATDFQVPNMFFLVIL